MRPGQRPYRASPWQSCSGWPGCQVAPGVPHRAAAAHPSQPVTSIPCERASKPLLAPRLSGLRFPLQLVSAQYELLEQECIWIRTARCLDMAAGWVVVPAVRSMSRRRGCRPAVMQSALRRCPAPVWVAWPRQPPQLCWSLAAQSTGLRGLPRLPGLRSR